MFLYLKYLGGSTNVHVNFCCCCDFLPDGVGVAMPAALEPTGVIPLCSMGVEEGVCPAGVSSQRDLRLLAGVGVSEGAPSPPLSVRGVSAHPLPWPGVSVIRRAKHNDVSSQGYVIIITQVHRRLRTRRALTMFNNVLLRTRRALLP